MIEFHDTYVKKYPVLFGLTTLRNLSLFVEYLLVFAESNKIRLVRMVKRSVTQHRRNTVQELGRLLEVPNVKNQVTEHLPIRIFFEGGTQGLEIMSPAV